MIEELVTQVFATRNAAHILHWKETSGYRHVVLGEFYADVIGRIDAVVEAYQGAFERIKVPPLPKLERVGDSIVSRLEDDLMFIAKNRTAISKGVPAIDNLLQGLEDLYLSTLFKLKNLG